jgi:hypothetical protein
MNAGIPTSALRRSCTFAAAGLASLLSLAAGALGPETHVEFDLSHTERVAGVNSVLTDSNLPAGIDGTDHAIDTGTINGTFGDHEVTVEATVDSPAGLTRLRARGEHNWELSGDNLTTDQWRLVTGTQTIRATHVDELTFSGAPFEPLTVEMYWEVRGSDDALIDLLASQSVVYSFDTDVSLTASTVAPNSGGGGYAETVPWPGGFRTTDLNQTKQVEPDEEFVVMTFEVDPGEALEVETVFEVSPFTQLSNSFEGFTMSTEVDGHHDARFDQSAVLVGVVVKNSLGNVLPGITILADSGNSYPVLDEAPVPLLPERVILSPVAISDNSMGEVGASTPVGNMINQSGLVKTFSSGVSGFDRYFDFNPVPFTSATFTNNWQSQVDFTLPLTGHVDFDLGGTYAIDRLALWNVSLENVRVQLATAPTGPWTEVGAYALVNHIPFLSYSADVLDLGGLFDASHVRIEVDSAHKFAASDTFTYAIVGEVAVSAVPVPEPGATLMWQSGVTCLALLSRMRARRYAARRRPVPVS